MSGDDELIAACPFCGSVATPTTANGETWISCVSCDASGRMCSQEHAAIAAWNRREAASRLEGRMKASCTDIAAQGSTALLSDGQRKSEWREWFGIGHADTYPEGVEGDTLVDIRMAAPMLHMESRTEFYGERADQWVWDREDGDPPIIAWRPALSTSPDASSPNAVSGDVARLVVAARIVANEDQSPECLRELDEAAEAFASRVAWDDDASSPGEGHKFTDAGYERPSRTSADRVSAPGNDAEAASVIPSPVLDAVYIGDVHYTLTDKATQAVQEAQRRLYAAQADADHWKAEWAAEVGKRETLSGAISWIEPPFVTDDTPADELRKRVKFVVQDAARSLLNPETPSTGETRQSAPSPWRSVETDPPPRDGTEFLAHASKPGWTATRVVSFRDPDDRLPTHGERVVWPSAPTHWMPLPPPPLRTPLGEGGET